MKRFLCGAFSVLFLLASFASCGNRTTEKLGYLLVDGAQVYPESVLQLDGETIGFDEFRYYYLNYRDLYLEEDPAAFESETKETELKNEVLQSLLYSYAVRFLAKENGISLTKEEKNQVQNDIETTIDFYGGRDAFLTMLHESYMSEQYYREMMEYSALHLKLFDTLFAEGGAWAWDEETFYRYYEENYLAVQVVYLAYRDNETAENHPKTLALSQEIYEKAAAGEDFWGLIEAYGEDSEMEGYPDGYYITEGEAENVLYEASKALAIEAISEPVAGGSGIYIIKRVPLKKERMDENKETALMGYTDSAGTWHSGAYDSVFADRYEARAAEITATFGEYWDKISSQSMF